MLLNNRFSCISDESEGSFSNHHEREEPDIIMLRPNSQHYPGSPAGSSTKGSSHQVEHQAREVV